MPSTMRYLVTVRRLMSNPSLARMSAISWSDKGFLGSSDWMSLWILSLTDRELSASPPSWVAMPPEKNAERARTPPGVWMYWGVIFGDSVAHSFEI